MSLRYPMIYPILRWQRDKILVTPAAGVNVFDGRLAALVEDMYCTMHSVNGVGLAAPQIGIGERIAVIDTGVRQSERVKLVLINPTIIAREGRQTGQEGCLSLPGFRTELTRPASVTVRAQNIDGEWFERACEGLLARAVVHETDHLDGKLFVHRISGLKRGMIDGKVKRLMKRGRW